MDKILILT